MSDDADFGVGVGDGGRAAHNCVRLWSTMTTLGGVCAQASDIDRAHIVDALPPAVLSDFVRLLAWTCTDPALALRTSSSTPLNTDDVLRMRFLPKNDEFRRFVVRCFTEPLPYADTLDRVGFENVLHPRMQPSVAIAGSALVAVLYARCAEMSVGRFTEYTRWHNVTACVTRMFDTLCKSDGGGGSDRDTFEDTRTCIDVYEETADELCLFAAVWSNYRRFDMRFDATLRDIDRRYAQRYALSLHDTAPKVTAAAADYEADAQTLHQWASFYNDTIVATVANDDDDDDDDDDGKSFLARLTVWMSSSAATDSILKRLSRRVEVARRTSAHMQEVIDINQAAQVQSPMLLPQLPSRAPPKSTTTKRPRIEATTTQTTLTSIRRDEPWVFRDATWLVDATADADNGSVPTVFVALWKAPSRTALQNVIVRGPFTPKDAEPFGVMLSNTMKELLERVATRPVDDADGDRKLLLPHDNLMCIEKNVRPTQTQTTDVLRGRPVPPPNATMFLVESDPLMCSTKLNAEFGCFKLSVPSTEAAAAVSSSATMMTTTISVPVVRARDTSTGIVLESGHTSLQTALGAVEQRADTWVSFILTMIYRRAFYVSTLRGIYVDIAASATTKEAPARCPLVRSCIESDFIGARENMQWTAWKLAPGDDAATVHRSILTVAKRVTTRALKWVSALAQAPELVDVRAAIGEQKHVDFWTHRLRSLSQPQHFILLFELGDVSTHVAPP